MEIRVIILVSTILALFMYVEVMGQDVEWSHYGNDAGGQRFARIDQISSSNVSDLKVAWQFQTGELDRYQNASYLLERAAFEATPLMVNRMLYFPTPSNILFALDASDGHEVWKFDPEIDIFHIELSEMTCRGVGYWTDGQEERLFMGTIDGRLFSIDAKTGKADTTFNGKGFVDLKLGTGLVQMTSAPAVYKDLVIVGSSIGDNNRTHESRGTVRAYDVRSGDEIWRFDPIPTTGTHSSWKEGSNTRTGAANVWSTISVDKENGLVFLPTSSPSPDFYGGERLGNNDYANSVVALDAGTGAYRWHFQVVHHDLWDYDIAAQPVLFDYIGENGNVDPAVAIGTKMGHIFVLNRLDGTPILPYEERDVPRSNIPGEIASPTQPFPIKPEPLSLHNLTVEDIWGPTEEERDLAVEDFKQRRYEGVFTPPSFEGTLVAPGNIGGIHWGGMSIDPENQILVTNINHMPHVIQLFDRHTPEIFNAHVAQTRTDENQVNPETNRMFGTPYKMSRTPYIKATKDGAWGLTRPPWGTILAIDLSTGDKRWEKPLGYMHPDEPGTGSINLGGTCLTSGGLTFVAATIDNHLRAFDTKEGKLLWEHALPASGIATPMTYFLDGKQYIVISAGGHGKNGFTTKGDYVIAFSLEK